MIVGIRIMLLCALMGVSTARAPRLVAPVYPGAVADTDAGDVTVRVYLSRDPLSKVTSWYANRIGPLTRERGSYLWASDRSNYTAGRPVLGFAPVEHQRLGGVVMAQYKVARSLHDITKAKDAGVMCEDLRFDPQERLPQASRQMLGSLSPEDRAISRIGGVFAELKKEVYAGRHTKQELIAAYGKYRHLETSWYRSIKTDTGTISYDRWLLAREQQKLSGQEKAAAAPAMTAQKDVQALAARLQAAAMAGRMKEVEALNAELQAAMQAQQGKTGVAVGVANRDRWNFWLAFLKDLDAHAYRTRIWINTPPQGWGY